MAVVAMLIVAMVGVVAIPAGTTAQQSETETTETTDRFDESAISEIDPMWKMGPRLRNSIFEHKRVSHTHEYLIDVMVIANTSDQFNQTTEAINTSAETTYAEVSDMRLVEARATPDQIKNISRWNNISAVYADPIPQTGEITINTTHTS